MFRCFWLFPRRPPTPERVCSLAGCSRPCFLEPSGRVHDFCGLTHARAFDSKRAADLDRHRRAGQDPSHGHSKRGGGPVPAGCFNENEEYWTEEMVLFWHPPSVFSQWTPAAFVVDNVSLVCGGPRARAVTAGIGPREASLPS